MKTKITIKQKRELLDFILGSINEVELSYRSANRLNNMKIEKVWQTFLLTDEEFLQIKRVGPVILREIRKQTTGPWKFRTPERLSFCTKEFRLAFREKFDKIRPQTKIIKDDQFSTSVEMYWTTLYSCLDEVLEAFFEVVV